ncbi:hypothetical protein BDK51DRAFT_28450, partial [Blyttiomyces helicus]
MLSTTPPLPLPSCIPLPTATSLPGESVPRINSLTLERAYRCSRFGEATIFALFQRGQKLSPSRPCLGTRHVDPETGVAGHYVWASYEEVAARVENVGAGLVSLGLNQGDRVGSFASNREEYAISQLAAFRQGLTSVPIYDTIVRDDATVLAFMLNKCQLAVVFTVAAH